MPTAHPRIQQKLINALIFFDETFVNTLIIDITFNVKSNATMAGMREGPAPTHLIFSECYPDTEIFFDRSANHRCS
jgi:hypothetical protein